MFTNICKDKKVLVIRHTSIKRTWLTTWLLKLVANVMVISKDIPTHPSIFEELRLEENKKEFFSVVLLSDNYQKLTIAPKTWVAFRGLGESLKLTLNVASIEHEFKQAINIDPKDINYEW